MMAIKISVWTIPLNVTASDIVYEAYDSKSS